MPITAVSYIHKIAAVALMCFVLVDICAAQRMEGVGVGNWLSISSNLDMGYRKTQFFASHYNTAIFQWDSRVEFWLPPFRDKFSWGPYIRVAGIKGSQVDAWQNAWLSGPGFGLQLYPLSSWRFQSPHSLAGRIFGPLRLFGEYSFTNYWGRVNQWRPRNQARTGLDYWKASNVNEPSRFWWTEIWNGFFWQSSNEFTDRYDSIVFANAVRFGVRKPHSAISVITPYLALESSRTKYHYAGATRCIFAQSGGVPNPCDFYWENRLLAGGGLRFAPSLAGLARENRAWLTRFVVYGEYMNTAAYYYGLSAPSPIPRYDVRLGVSANIGNWYK
jgi:hypothetical protein